MKSPKVKNGTKVSIYVTPQIESIPRKNLSILQLLNHTAIILQCDLKTKQNKMKPKLGCFFFASQHRHLDNAILFWVSHSQWAHESPEKTGWN